MMIETNTPGPRLPKEVRQQLKLMARTIEELHSDLKQLRQHMGCDNSELDTLLDAWDAKVSEIERLRVKNQVAEALSEMISPQYRIHLVYVEGLYYAEALECCMGGMVAQGPGTTIADAIRKALIAFRSAED